MTDSPERVDVFDYDDYRVFLRDYYEQKKEESPRTVTYRSLSRQAGFKAPNFIHLVINNKRNLGIHSIRKLVQALNLGARESQYLENLVLYNQARTHNDKLHYFRRMNAFKKAQEAKLIEGAEINLFAKWYYPVVRELVMLHDFCEEASWMARKIVPALSVEEAREAWDFLVRNGFVVKDENERWLHANPQIKTRDRGVAGPSIKDFHNTMIELGRKSLIQPAHTRHITTMTMSLSQAQFCFVIKKIIAFQEELRQLLQQAVPEEFVARLAGEQNVTPTQELSKTSAVAQFNIQFFKMTS